jgi:hypothetical protein
MNTILLILAALCVIVAVFAACCRDAPSLRHVASRCYGLTAWSAGDGAMVRAKRFPAPHGPRP